MKKILAITTISLVGFISVAVWFTRDQVTNLLNIDDLKVTTINVSFANIFLIERNDKLIMIDSGNPGHGPRIEAQIDKAGYDPKDIDYLILTHGHLDHSGTARYFKDKYGMKIIGHAGDNESFSTGKRMHVCPTNRTAKFFKSISGDIKIDPFDVDILINEEYDLDQLGISGKIIPWPGHTDGSIVIQFDDAVFVGDLIAGEPLSPQVPMTHFFMCDLEQNRQQIRRLLEKKEIKTWYLGHFGPLLPEAVEKYLISISNAGSST
ncbi:MAG: MBL fold metallo-hydrolase [Pseudomonadales bacterium]|nr:MBL fold metallo-hydrolase [Pseudomonadales bacterium]